MAPGLQANPGFLGSLLRYDLTRGGQLYQFAGRASINQLALFGEDSITLGNLTLSIGLRFDRYHGLTDGGGLQPRGSFSYLIKPTKTVVRGGYSHTIETPTNENLVVSSSTGSGGLASNLFEGGAEQQPIALGSRNQYDAGIQQSLGKWVLVDVSYFRKYTRNAFDFDTLFSTPITFPIGWRQSKLDGVSARISSIEIHGLRVYATMGHANARFFGPENGGVIFNSNLSVGAYRQDHDQIYQQNVNLRYQPKQDGWWSDFTWRYDSGLVVGAVNNLADALALDGRPASDDRPLLRSPTGLTQQPHQQLRLTRLWRCSHQHPGPRRGERRPQPAADHAPQYLQRQPGQRQSVPCRAPPNGCTLTIFNLSNEAALYNFLSPFGGTHWVQPRSFQAQLGWAF